MWLPCLLLSIFFIVGANIAIRCLGFNFLSFSVYSFLILIVPAWMLPYVYKVSPTFYKPYIIANATVVLLGWAASVFIFKEQIVHLHLAGMCLILFGTVLLGVKC